MESTRLVVSREKQLRSATIFEGHLQNLHAGLRVKTVRELASAQVPLIHSHDRRQLEDAFLQLDVGDAGDPHQIQCRDLPEIHQTMDTVK